MIPTPGAAMSGLTRSAPVPSAGPRDEKPAICGSGVGLEPVVLPTAKDALGARLFGAHLAASLPASPETAAEAASTSGADGSGERLRLTPRYFLPLPSTTVPSNRCAVVAATVVSHGAWCSTEVAAGPLLPADADTNTPAAAACRKARSSRSKELPPPTE